MDTNTCTFLQSFYEKQCKKDYKPATDFRLLPVVEELHKLNCLKSIELGMQLCKELNASNLHTPDKDS